MNAIPIAASAIVDGKALTLLIHNILTTPNALYEIENWLKPLDAVKLGMQLDQAALIQDDRINMNSIGNRTIDQVQRDLRLGLEDE